MADPSVLRLDAWWSTWRWIARLSLLGLLLPFMAQGLTAWGGAVAWLIDQASHWQSLYLLGLLVGAGLAGWRQRRWWLALCALPLPWYSASPSLPTASGGQPVLAVASANVRVSNHDVQPLAHWVQSEAPDLLVLLEVSPEYALGLAAMPGYPYRKVIAERSPFGMALLSKWPLNGTQVVRDASGVPRIETRVQWGEQRVRLTVFHPVPPVSPAYRRTRDQQIQATALAAQASDAKVPALMVGDFNATPWSSAFGGVREAGWRRATGIWPTWPVRTGGWFGLPIDHVLASPHWRLETHTLGPAVGSDHWPILVRLVLPPPAQTRTTPAAPARWFGGQA